MMTLLVWALSDPETALRELLQPILNLARLITARQLTGAEGDAKALFAIWNIDGTVLELLCLTGREVVGCSSGASRHDGRSSR